jgi:hypothetical protein
MIGSTHEASEADLVVLLGVRQFNKGLCLAKFTPEAEHLWENVVSGTLRRGQDQHSEAHIDLYRWVIYRHGTESLFHKDGWRLKRRPTDANRPQGCPRL